MILINNFYIMSKQTMGLLLLVTLSFLLSFIINTLLHFVIQDGTIPVFKQTCKYFVSRSCKFVILLNQNSCTPSSPGAFEFDIPEIHSWMLSTVTIIFFCFSTSANSCFTLCNNLASWLWVDGKLPILLRNFIASSRSGDIFSSLSLPFSSSFYFIIFQIKTNIMYFHFKLTYYIYRPRSYL